MIAQELVSLHMAFVEACQKRHEFITVEHLLLALLDNPTAAEVLRACGANMDELRKNLTQHIAEQTPRIAADREVDTQPTLGFQRDPAPSSMSSPRARRKSLARTCWWRSSARRIRTRCTSRSSRASRASTW